jgi:hypothetical protein
LIKKEIVLGEHKVTSEWRSLPRPSFNFSIGIKSFYGSDYLYIDKWGNAWLRENW